MPNWTLSPVLGSAYLKNLPNFAKLGLNRTFFQTLIRNASWKFPLIGVFTKSTAIHFRYSGSQNHPNVLSFGTDGLDAEWWHKQWFWNFYQTNYTFLALQSTWSHVIWIKTHGVMSRTILWLIGTVLWASIFLHVLPLLKPKTISNVTVGTINNVIWCYLY